MSTEMKNRLSLENEYVQNNPKCTQQEVVVYLEKELNIHFTQSTVSRDIKHHLGYTKIDGKWVKPKYKMLDREEQILKDIIYQDQPLIYKYSKQMKLIFIKTNSGKENTLADFISSIFEKSIIGVFTGIDCLMIVTNKENANIIYDKLINWKVSDDK